MKTIVILLVSGVMTCGTAWHIDPQLFEPVYAAGGILMCIGGCILMSRMDELMPAAR